MIHCDNKSLLKILLLHILLIVPTALLGQSYDEIVSSGNYLYGEGEASSSFKADRLALSAISEQISVEVRSEITMNHTSRRSEGEVDSETRVEDLIETYSTASLTNCQKLVLENGPKTYRILRYVHKSEIARMFEAREQKVLEMVGIAARAEQEGKYDIALRYYYWAQLLLDMVLYPGDLYYDTDQGSQKVLLWIPLRINAILDGLSFAFGGYASEDKTLATMYVTCGGKPVTSLDYSYWDGVDWSALTQAKDGLSAIELRANSGISSINVKIEYSYEQELQLDPEFSKIAEFLQPKSYTKAYKNYIPLKGAKQHTLNRENNVTMNDVAEMAVEKSSGAPVGAPSASDVVAVNNVEPYRETVSLVVEAINNRNYDGVRNLFTPEGLEVYNKLIKYGRARTLTGDGFDPLDEIEVVQFDGGYYCRSIPMQFSFSGNKSFVESVVFEMDAEGKISALQFGLEQSALNDILGKSQWGATAKLVIVNFLENYKTAFALTRLDYLESIFSDDALIITGRVVQPTSVENQINLQNKQHIVYNRQTKAQYINNLRRSFSSKEYINLQFSNLRVSKMGRGDQEVYCMEIKQDYYSSNYGDTGYLMLVVDVTDHDRPIVHVRTWQPEPDPEFGLFSPGDM